MTARFVVTAKLSENKVAVLDLKTFEERYKIIQSIKDELQLGFDPNKEFKDDELMIQILPQEKIPNDDKIMWSLHNKYVSEG